MTSVLDKLGLDVDPMLPPEITRLSPSALEGLRCPEQFRRERILGEKSSVGPALLYGSAFHRALEHNFRQKIESRADLKVSEVADVAGDSWVDILEETIGSREITWGDSKPADVQDEVVRGVSAYMSVLAPTVQPVAVERWVEVPLPIGVPLVGRIDVETEQGAILDLKTKGSRPPQNAIDKSYQASSYLWSRQQEGNPATGFAWHVAVRTKTPQVCELWTQRSDAQLRSFERYVSVSAQYIRWLYDTFGPDEAWPGAQPNDNLCAKKYCGFWDSCVWRGGAV